MSRHSKNIQKKNKKESTDILGNLEKLIEKYWEQADQSIYNILLDSDLDKDSIKKISTSIRENTLAVLRDRYTFTENFVVPIRSGKKMYVDLANQYADFINWVWIALTIPFYHSLGDTLGYYNGNWENYGDVDFGPDDVNERIYDFISLGGINDISIRNWLASDDTIMYISTMQVLSDTLDDTSNFGEKIKSAYLKDLPLIEDRGAGITTKLSLQIQENIGWDKMPYNSKAKGAGSAMRSGSIGIFYPGERNREKLVQFAVDSSRITHNSAISILGSVVAALFTAYALERININEWPHKLLDFLKTNIVDDYIKKTSSNEYFSKFSQEKILYKSQWQKYVDRFFPGITPKLDDIFMKNLVQRYKYLSENYSKDCDVPFSCGDDCLIMAYDSVLRSNGSFEKLIFHSILHPGDADTVGAIAFSWFGGYYHSPQMELLVDEKFENLEFHTILYDFFEQNISKMAKIYYYDIYMDVARQYLKKYIKN